MAQRIIIDTDPGVDDAMAIFFALRSPELELIGLTTIFGNVETQLATTNALRLLEIAGRTDIPVAHGAENPLARPYGGAVPYVHGDDGQGNVHLPLPKTQAVDQSAAAFIVEQIMNNPGQITLVPVGPLTNIALALRLEPRIAQHVREVVLMGGNAFCPGNATVAAEANIANDAEAADVVFGAGWPITMVGLDVTHKVQMTQEHLKHYQTMPNALAQHVANIVPFYAGFYKQVIPDMDGIYIHDSSAIAYLLDPTLFKTEQMPVRVETQGMSRGKTWAAHYRESDRFEPFAGRPLVNICVEVDGERAVALELERMKGA